jgi:asparagine synthase (glutamine-hydrolysing)
MCGILACALGAGSSEAAVLAVADRLRHRGPDGDGSWRGGRMVLAHHRLAIVDLSGGAQPMTNEDGTLALVFNGEIYNHSALRSSLAARHRFRTESDAEVLLHLYEEVGADLVHRLQGMFAFVLTDGTRWLAGRDALGIKPLYRGWGGDGSVWFASEMKALTGPCTRIEEIPAGSLCDERETIRRWFVPSWSGRVGSQGANLAGLRDALEVSVHTRLMSDVPVGVLLSGGVDSSVVAALARPHVGELHSFSVGLPGSPDLAAARVVAEHLGTIHHERTYTPGEAIAALPDVVRHLESYDRALVRSAIPCWFVSQLAAEHVKVVLTGEGADEVFAGYDWMRHIDDPVHLHRECVRLLLGLDRMNLRRVDRMTMAHGLEGRVPFLDVAFLDHAMAIDPSLKLHMDGRPGKWLLRAAASQLLPESICGRPKAEFAQGCGSELILDEWCEETIGESALSSAALEFPHDPPTSKEELLYRRVFAQHYPGLDPLRTVSKWANEANGRAGDEIAEGADSTATDAHGTKTYSETVLRGFYDRYTSGLHGKYDNVRVYWEDELTRSVLRKYVKEISKRVAAEERGVRVLDLGCGAGQGFELLTRIPQSGLSLDDHPRMVLPSDELELYVGIDLSQAMIEQGRRNYRANDAVWFEKADLRAGIGPAAHAAPFDIYFSSYAALSHLTGADLRACLRSIAMHARHGALVVLDVLGRHSPEWPAYWRVDDPDRMLPYSMSYLYAPEERATGGVEKFPARFWTTRELLATCQAATEGLASGFRVLETLDRSIFVGRHTDTGEYGCAVPPLRRVVGSLFAHNHRTSLDELEVVYQPVEGCSDLNTQFSEMARCWNTLVEFTAERLGGWRIELAEVRGWSSFPPALQMALVTMDRVIDSVAWIDVGDVRANVIEPQLAYVLRRLQYRMQRGLGSGHGLVAILKVERPDPES